jgi:hypothetical protein
MNLVILVGLGVIGVATLWLVQTVVLFWQREPLALPLRYTSQAPLVRWSGSGCIQLIWFLILVGFPWAIGVAPLAYWAERFASPPWFSMVFVFCAFLLAFAVAYALEFALGWVRIEPKWDARTRRGKLFRRFLTPLPLAVVEEAVFRGVVLEQVYQVLPIGIAGAGAVVIAAAIFSAVHFIRPGYPGRPTRQAAFGFFMAGCLFGVAYLCGGHTLWFPIAVHAAGILGTEVMRLYVVHEGPPLLIGYPAYPHSGLCGAAAMLAMAGVIASLS